MAKLFLTRQEAADLCGVDPQTITNWAKAGFFKMTGKSTLSHVNRKSFEQWLSDMDSYTILDKEKTLSQYDKEITQLLKGRDRQRMQLKCEVEELKIKTEMQKVKGDYLRMVTAGMFNDLLTSLFLISDNHDTPEDLLLRHREIAILRSIANGEVSANISRQLDVSPERVRQIFNRAIRRVSESTKYWQEYIQEERPRLQTKVALQHDHIKALQHDLAALQAETNLRIKSGQTTIFNTLHSECAKADLNGNETQRILWLMQTRVTDLNTFSVRTLNCLACRDIKTMFQLVTTKNQELKRTRNFGKKSLMEIEEVLNSLGFQLGMNFDNIQVEICNNIIKEIVNKLK